MDAWLSGLSQTDPVFTNLFQGIARYLVPILLFLLLVRVSRQLLTFRREPELWAWLVTPEGKRLPITHWETVIGRSKRSDVVLPDPTVSRNHAVLTRYDDGSWTISDAESQNGTRVNGAPIRIAVLEPEDTLQIGRYQFHLQPISREQEIKLAQLRTPASSPGASLLQISLLTVLQLIICFSYLLQGDGAHSVGIFAGFMGVIACQWLLLLFYLAIKKPSFELETLAFALCTLGMTVLAAAKPAECVKQLVAMVLGVCLYLGIGWSVRDLERAKRIRYLAGIMGIGLLVVTLLFGKSYHGAKNWLIIGKLSLQPSELSKICFVYMGASAMERIMNKRNLILFIAYTIAICGCLAVMNDFGTAMIFFVAFLLIAYFRSGSVGTIALACTALGFAGVLVLKIAPHALRRFATWGHIWDDPLKAGYQQTRCLMCIASGGLLGLGAGKGWMHHVFAADSDVAFATLSEEWGLLICLMAVACIMVMGLFSIRTAALGRSSFYVIGTCTAAGLLVVQTMFNVLGTVDILPLTGVTFPFLSNGGSSMMSVWGLLAFIKASDTRQNASFAVRQSREGRPEEDE